MTINDFESKSNEKLKSFDYLVIEHKDAWLNEDGTDNAMIDGKSVFLDIEDENVRKDVFLRSIFMFIQKVNWHTDIIKSIDDIDNDNPNSKVFIIIYGGGMFPNYRVYLKKDYNEFEKVIKDTLNLKKTLWKTDREFFKDCVIEICESIDFDSYYGFADHFDNNVYGIKMIDIDNDIEAKGWLMDTIYNSIKNKRMKNNHED